jgi:hypothetical protein
MGKAPQKTVILIKRSSWKNLCRPRRVLSSAIQRRIVFRKSSYDSEQHVASIFRIEEYAKRGTSMNQAARKENILLAIMWDCMET